MKRFLVQIIAGILGLWLAISFLPEVQFLGSFWLLAIAGFILGAINFFIKPLFDLITFPLKILTFGLFALLLNMAFVWLLDIFFKELEIIGLIPLLLTTLMIRAVSLLLSFLGRKVIP